MNADRHRISDEYLTSVYSAGIVNQNIGKIRNRRICKVLQHFERLEVFSTESLAQN
jgi:hypothetical protein